MVLKTRKHGTFWLSLDVWELQRAMPDLPTRDNARASRPPL